MKLLVTTDFSTNSKGAIRFAQTLAKQSKEIEVTSYHSVLFMKPSTWSDALYNSYKHEEITRLTKALTNFVSDTIGADRSKFAGVHYVIDSAISTEKDIIKYAEKRKMDIICIATQGAGMLRKIMGTHTSYIVNNSLVPVLVIPSHYRSKPIKKVTYLSDFENVKRELDKVSKLSSTLKCSVDVLHYASIIPDKKQFERNEALVNSGKYENTHLQVIKSDVESSLMERVAQYINKSKPQLLIMFTKREKSFFERIFLPSKSAELTYTTKVPVLIYSKK
jgi:nucleotide-binding universal stress UspA family protein